MTGPLFWVVLLVVKTLLLLFVAEAIAAKTRNAATRHWVWAATLGLLLALPIMQATLPALSIRLPQTLDLNTQPTLTAASVATAPPAPGAGSGTATDVASQNPLPTLGVTRVSEILVVLYFVGLAWGLVWSVLGRMRLRGWLSRGAQAPAALRACAAELQAQLGLRRAIKLVTSPSCPIPCALGLRRTTVLLPAAASQWSEGRLRRVLLHELAHVRRWDVVGHLLAELARIVYWPHPWVYRAAREMRWAAELACDDVVLRHGAAPTAYAHDLVALASDADTPLVPAMASRALLPQRVDALLDGERVRRGLGIRVALMAFVMLCAVALPLSALQPFGQVSRQTLQDAAMPFQARWFRPGLDVAAFVQGPVAPFGPVAKTSGFVLLFEVTPSGSPRSFQSWSVQGGASRQLTRSGGSLGMSAGHSEAAGEWPATDLSELAARLPAAAEVRWPHWLVAQKRGGGGSTMNGVPATSRDPRGLAQAGWWRGVRRAGAFTTHHLRCSALDDGLLEPSSCVSPNGFLAFFDHDSRTGELRVAEYRRNAAGGVDVALSRNGRPAAFDAGWAVWVHEMFSELPQEFFLTTTLARSP